MSIDTPNNLHSEHLSETRVASASTLRSVESSSIAGLRKGIRLAAAPTFVVMAMVSSYYQSVHSGHHMGGDSMFVTGMVFMYVLMGIFHVGPWLQLIERFSLRENK